MSMHNFEMILSQNHSAQYGYKDNANILVLGQVGTHKTRGHILPNILQQDRISMVIADTKGELHSKTGKLLKERGYKIKCVNFDDPSSSLNQFNPFAYIKTPEDIVMVSNILVSEVRHDYRVDAYWDNAAQLLLNAIIGYMVDECRPTERNLNNLRKLVCALEVSDDLQHKSPLEILFTDLRNKKPRCYAVQQWDAFCTIKAAAKTASTILSVLLTKFAQFLTPDIAKLTGYDTVDLDQIAREKTALFVCVSDVDRSKDKLASIFYSLLFARLRNLADKEPSKGLPIHVHCFLDDFSTNVVIPNFDNYISSFRSREISFTLVLQSESQLQKLYGESSHTIVANCAHYLFMGSSDLHTCHAMAKRMNLPLDKVLYKPREEIFLLRSFSRPVVDNIFDIRSHKDYSKLEHEDPMQDAFQQLGA